MSRKRKSPEEKSKPRNITFVDAVWAMAERRSKELHFSSVAQYLADLVKQDGFEPPAVSSRPDRADLGRAGKAAARSVKKPTT